MEKGAFLAFENIYIKIIYEIFCMMVKIYNYYGA